MIKKIVAMLALVSSTAFSQTGPKNYNLEVTCGYEPVKLYSMLQNKYEEQPLFISNLELNDKLVKVGVLFLNPAKKTGTLVFYRTKEDVCVMIFNNIDFQVSKQQPQGIQE